MVVIIFRDFLIFYEVFLSPQVTRGVVVSNKNGIYKLRPNDLKLRILENQDIPRKSQNCMKFSLVPSPPPKMKNFVNTSGRLQNTRSGTFPVIRSFT